MRREMTNKGAAFAVLLGLALPMTSLADDTPKVTCCEVIATNAAAGYGGNAWGGHQTRIVRTAAGVFAAYTVAGADELHRRWRLVTQTEDGRWPVLAEEPCGREPMNLMAAPDGTLHIIAWPDGRPRLWSGLPKGGAVTMQGQAIDGPWITSNWPYNAAGISERGDLALVQSDGEAPGTFIWGYRPAGAAAWITGRAGVAQRHCYTCVLPGPDGRLAFSSTRDVLARTMGYDKTATSHSLGYVFNRLGIWETGDVARLPLGELQVDETVPTAEFPEVWACGLSCDTYRDTRGRLHVLYFFRGPETRGKHCIRHAIVETGGLVKTVTLPPELDACFAAAGPAGEKTNPSYCRMIQDTAGRFYLIGTTAIVPAGATDGTELAAAVPLDLGGHAVEYSGMALASPRGGTLLADVVDAVFPSDQGRSVVYVRIQIKGADYTRSAQ